MNLEVGCESSHAYLEHYLYMLQSFANLAIVSVTETLTRLVDICALVDE